MKLGSVFEDKDGLIKNEFVVKISQHQSLYEKTISAGFSVSQVCSFYNVGVKA